MKRNSTLWALAVATLLAGCQQRKPTAVMERPMADSIVIESMPDSTVYGTCGDGTSMHSLQLVTGEGDTLVYQIDVDEDAHVRGGMMVGDRLAVIGHASGDELVAQGVLNLTTLLGKWTSIDRSFEILEGGVLMSESNEAQVGEWKVSNGRLVLRTDTFSVFELGQDSLLLESERGIFAYKRQR